MVAPITPGLNDREIPALLSAAAKAGARFATCALLRLPPEVEPLFRARLEAAMPTRAAAILRALAEVRGGRVDERRFGHRMRGSGPRWQLITDLFHLHRRRLHVATPPPLIPSRPRQGELFPVD